MRRAYEVVQGRYDALVAQEKSHWSDAKASLGMFSQYGVAETRELFWKRFGQGKDFAKRQTTWDALFVGLRMGRDEGLGAYVIRLLFNMLVNFTIGLCGAVVRLQFSINCDWCCR